MKTYYYCELDNTGQRTGNYYSIELPVMFVINRFGCEYCAFSIVHESGYIADGGKTFLYSSESEAIRAALS